MNERIKKLAFQAMGINQKVSDDNFFVEVSKLKEFEKFAELIVKECRAIAIQRLAIGTDKYTASHNGALWGVINEIDKHFGVEE